VLAHHERWGGGGYPHGIAAASIPIEARILSVADAYEAMTAVRPYRTSPLDAESARQELCDGAGTQFDPEVVEAFLSVLGAE
jgi:HD-GYP domain-containing protein (c-di-GMP phosphodiesterase class II)